MRSIGAAQLNDLCQALLQAIPTGMDLASVRDLRTALCAAADDTDLVETTFERVFADLVDQIDDPLEFEVASDALTRLYDAWLERAQVLGSPPPSVSADERPSFVPMDFQRRTKEARWR